MRRGTKVWLGVLVFLAAVGGYGVYWWHEGQVDAGSIPPLSEAGLLRVDSVRKLLLSPDPQVRGRARAEVDILSEDDRIELFRALVVDPDQKLRLFAVGRMEKYRDTPAVRALLAETAVRDKEDREVRDAAQRALGASP
jgi:HEAT repeat protein